MAKVHGDPLAFRASGRDGQQLHIAAPQILVHGIAAAVYKVRVVEHHDIMAIGVLAQLPKQRRLAGAIGTNQRCVAGLEVQEKAGVDAKIVIDLNPHPSPPPP